ncbi:hypothetical protein QJS66_08175 [Kocuria rhizophila]|nr:hypothetical protein QJS66_08175 [Kocuria rhizophila]
MLRTTSTGSSRGPSGTRCAARSWWWSTVLAPAPAPEPAEDLVGRSSARGLARDQAQGRRAPGGHGPRREHPPVVRRRDRRPGRA